MIAEDAVLVLRAEAAARMFASAPELATRTVGAATLADLLLRGRLGVGSGRRPKVAVLDGDPMDDGVLDRALGELASRRRPPHAKAAVDRLAWTWQELTTRLIDRGLVRVETVKRQWGRDKVVHRPDPEALRAIDERLLAAVVAPASADLTTIALGAILAPYGLATIAYRVKARDGEAALAGTGYDEAMRALRAHKRLAERYAEVADQSLAPTCAAIAALAKAAGSTRLSDWGAAS